MLDQLALPSDQTGTARVRRCYGQDLGVLTHFLLSNLDGQSQLPTHFLLSEIQLFNTGAKE